MIMRKMILICMTTSRRFSRRRCRAAAVPDTVEVVAVPGTAVEELRLSRCWIGTYLRRMTFTVVEEEEEEEGTAEEVAQLLGLPASGGGRRRARGLGPLRTRVEEKELRRNRRFPRSLL